MSFEDFAKDDPSQIVLGLFNGELQAVYLFSQISPTEFEAHFTSNRIARREEVLAGAQQLVEWFKDNGLEIIGYVAPENGPLRDFLETAGMVIMGQKEFSCQNDTDGGSLSSDHKTFVEYRSQVKPSGSFRIKAETAEHVEHDGELRVSNSA